jgi:hypothetical protein
MNDGKPLDLVKLLRQQKRGADWYCNQPIETTVHLVIEGDKHRWQVVPTIQTLRQFEVFGEGESMLEAMERFRNNLRWYVSSAITCDDLICFGNE